MNFKGAKMIIRISCLLFAFLFTCTVNAGQTWIVIGDSIMSDVPQGTSAQHSLHLVAAEKNVMFKSLASPGSSLGHTDKTGFNSDRATAAIDLISGSWGWYNGVLIQAGTNDFGRNVPWEDTVTSMRRILERVRIDGKKALVLDPIYRDGEDTPNALGNVLNTYRYFMWHVCTQEYADVCRFANRTNSVMGTLNNNYDSAEVVQTKRLHPNAIGHRKLADWIKLEAAAAGYF